MKKTYEAPELNIEVYQLDKMIASNCETVVQNGPGLLGHVQCDDYEGDIWATQSARSTRHNVNFYEDIETCDCYTSGGDGKYWQS